MLLYDKKEKKVKRKGASVANISAEFLSQFETNQEVSQDLRSRVDKVSISASPFEAHFHIVSECFFLAAEFFLLFALGMLH